MKTMSITSHNIWSKRFTMLFVLTIFDQMAFLCTRAIISRYALDLGFSESLAGTIAGALSVAALFSRPFAGRLLSFKRTTHKKILIASVTGSLLVTGCYLFFSSFILLMLVRILNGITYGISGTVELTMASNTLPEDNMGRGVGIFGLGNIIGLAAAPTISVWMYHSFGARALFMYCIATSVIALLIALLIPEDDGKTAFGGTVVAGDGKKETKGIRKFFSSEAVVPSILNFASQVAYASISAFIVVYGGTKGWGQIGLFYTAYAISLFAFRPLNGRLYDRLGIAPMVIFGNLSFACGILMIALTDNFLVCLLAAVFCAYGYGGAICTFQADAMKKAPRERRGVASGTYFMFNDLGGFFGATAAGVIAGLVGYGRMYIIFTLPLLLSIAFYGLAGLFRNLRKQSAWG